MSESKDSLKKLVMVIDAWFPHVGGGQIHAWELSKQLTKHGFEVTILTRNLGEWNEKYPGIEVIRFGPVQPFSNIWLRVYFLLRATIYCLTHSFDVFHAQAFSPGLIAPIVKYLKRKPTIFTVHGKGFKVAGINIGLSGLEDFVVYQIDYDLEITVAKNTLIKKTKAKKTIVIPNGVHIESFKPAIRNRLEVKKLLYIGRLSYEKGVDSLIKVFKKMENPNLNLTIIGDGVEMNALKQQATGLAVTFLGRLTGASLLNEMKKADLLIMPSRTEGQPLTLFEAWAAKLPIVITNVGDNGLYVTNQETGFLAEPTVESLEQKIHEAIGSSQLEAIAENGYQKVQKYTWKNVGEQTAKAMKELI